MPICNPMVWLFFLGVCAITLAAAIPSSALTFFLARAWRDRSGKEGTVTRVLPAVAAALAFLVVVAMACRLIWDVPLE